ncbi:DUF6650 family protein [Pandoraea soli]
MVKFLEIVNRLTGISTPIFGVSWNPPETERAVAQRVIAFLEDRRVLYSPSEVEVPEHCVHSIIEIRHSMTRELGALDRKSSIAQSLSSMRAACRKFLETVQADERRFIQFGATRGHYASWVFISALGELRGVFGIYLAALALAYGLDVEAPLAAILPPDTGGDETDA